jgi:transposase
MIFTESQLRYLAELPSAVAHALPDAANPGVPFFVKDPAVLNYELLRSVWVDGESIEAASSAARCSRTEYYKLENAFLRHGIAAAYPRMGSKDQSEKLERLVLIVKVSRPRATETAMLRVAEALRLDPRPSLRTIGHVLHCHGLGNTRDENDREYWRGIQESVRAVERSMSQTGPSRNKADRNATFYLPEEALQVRFELFRDLALNPDGKVGEAVRRYGISRPTFYKYLHRFRQYGPWGFVDWLQPGRGRGKVSEDLELRIIEEKLEHPRLSLDDLVSRMKLRCSRSAIYDVLRFWDLLGKDRKPVRLRGFWDEEEPEKPTALLRTAKEAAEAGQYQMPQKVNAHFTSLLDSLKRRPLAICEPGPIILAQFIADLGVCEALQLYGPIRREGGEITNLVLLNVCRILAGYETIGHLEENRDRSVAIAAGVGAYPGKTALYDGFSDLKFEHLQALRNDVAARARDLGLIRGARIAQDFHFKEFYGHTPDEEEIGRGPNGAHEVCPGFRPHVVWDLDADVLINIAFCNGSSRATRIVREFCEKNIYPILGRDAIREIYMDSEYTSFPVINYFVVDEFSNTDVTMCLKRNKRVDLLAKEVMAEGRWEPFGDEYEIAGKQFTLPNLAKPLHLVVKRNKKTGEVRCFGTTSKGNQNREVLERYRLRWPVENGLKDLIRSYFIDHLLGKDPEKIEANFYCIQVARLAYENFLQSLDERFVRDSSGYKKTLATFRHLLFGSHNCQIRLHGDHLEVDYLDTGAGELQSEIERLLARRTERGLNRVPWWGGLGLAVGFHDQCAEIFGGGCTKTASEEVS